LVGKDNGIIDTAQVGRRLNGLRPFEGGLNGLRPFEDGLNGLRPFEGGLTGLAPV
jgi:hypothetical protein